MKFDLLELIFRILSALFLIPVIYELWKLIKVISNSQFADIMKKLGIALGFFILLRILAAISDIHLGLELPVFGYIVNLTFWFWSAYYIFQQRRTLENEQFGDEGRNRLSKHIDDIINEIKQAKRLRKK